MHVREFIRTDGRKLTLYSRRPIPPLEPLPGPPGLAEPPNPHLRWQPLRGEWVTYAAHRQGRTFLPPPEYNPLRPSDDPAVPTELPCGDYDVAVFDNLFPSLTMTAHDPPDLPVPTQPGRGICEVVVFTQDPAGSLGRLPLDHIELLLSVWGHRTSAHAATGSIRCVLPFENRGVEVGVTLHHPHGQIYSYPFVPPVPGRIQSQEAAHYRQHGRGLLEMLIEAEDRDGRRMLYAGEHAVAFVPVCARYPYEVWVAPRRATPALADLDPDQRADLARALKSTLLRYDGLWQRPFPYVMAWYQSATDGQPHPEAHVHAEFYPPYRTRDKLKYLAGTELAAGLFASDTLPEDTARALQAVQVDLP